MSSKARARVEHPRFEIRERLGAGGNGVVYSAFDRVRSADVAIKTLRRPSTRALLSLKQEFRALADVAHPNLLTLYDLFVEGDDCFFTMEIVDGVDLTTYVRGIATSPRAATMETFASGVVTTEESRARPKPSATFDEAKLRSVLDQLSEGIRALHEQRMVHRDLKPSNVLVRRDGQVRILDYGLVSSREAHQGFEGTAAYAAPEQIEGAAGPEADWYAIGVMLFEAMTGLLPFEGSGLQMLVDKGQRDAPRVDAVVSGAPADLVELCAKLLSRDPVLREIAAVARTEALVGRDRELAVLDDALARSQKEARVLVVEGPSGIGKTTLIRAFLERARNKGAVVLETRCNPRETVPYNAFDGAIDELARVLRARGLDVDDPAIGRLFPVLGGDQPMSRDDVDADVVRRRAFAALRRLLGRLSPLIVFVDDFQWADRDSHALLAEIVHVPALFVLTQRESSGALPWAAETLVVPPLDVSSSRALVATLSEGTRDVEGLIELAGGHPLFLSELARYGGAASDLDDVLRARIAALPEELRRIVELSALAVVPLPAHVLAVAAGMDVAAAERSTELLRVARLVHVGARGVSPFHDRVREATTAAIAEPRRLHAALVRALSAGDEAHALVIHLAGAGDVDAAIAAALEAARRAEAALAFDRAAELLADAIALGARGDEVNGRLAEALENAHRGVEAAEVYLRIGDLRTRARAAELLLASGEIERGRGILGDVLEDAGCRLPETPAQAIAELVVERARLSMRGLEPARAHDLVAARHEELFRGVAHGLGMVDNLSAAVYNARALRAALDAGEPARAARALAVEAIFRGSVDVRKKPRGLLIRARALAGDDENASAWISSAEAVLDALTLDGPSVVSGLNRAEAFFQERTRGNGWALDSLKLVRALSLRLLGDLETLRHTVPEDIADARRRGDRYLETTMLRGATMIALCDGDVGRARTMIDGTAWAPVGDGFHIQHWLELEGRAEIDLYLGRAVETLERYDSQFAALRRSLIVRLQRPRILARTTRGKLLLARGSRAALLECSWIASRLDAEGLGYACARAALLRAGIDKRRGRDGSEALRRAIAICDRHGLGLSGAVARRRLGELSGDARLLAESDSWMARMRVHDPERVCAMEAP